MKLHNRHHAISIGYSETPGGELMHYTKYLFRFLIGPTKIKIKG